MTLTDEPSQDIAALLDYAERLPGFIASDDNLTEEFRAYLVDIVNRFPARRSLALARGRRDLKSRLRFVFSLKFFLCDPLRPLRLNKSRPLFTHLKITLVVRQNSFGRKAHLPETQTRLFNHLT
jgi:hypothetical protein